MPVGIWAEQMSTYQRVMKYICTHTHACTHAYMHMLAHVWPYIAELISSTGRHPLAAAFCRAPAWYMNYADARAQEECVCVCWGVCGSMEYVCVWLCLIYYILAFWQIAKRSSRFRTNFRVQLLFRHRCRCRCHSPILVVVPVVLVVILIVLMPIIIVVVCSTKSQKQITHHINGQWRCFLYMPCTGILINRLVLH